MNGGLGTRGASTTAWFKRLARERRAARRRHAAGRAELAERLQELERERMGLEEGFQCARGTCERAFSLLGEFELYLQWQGRFGHLRKSLACSPYVREA